MSYATSLKLRLPPLRLPPSALAQLCDVTRMRIAQLPETADERASRLFHERMQSWNELPKDTRYAPKIHTTFALTLERRREGAQRKYASAEALIEDAEEAAALLRRGAEWRFIVHGRGTSISMESQNMEAFDRRAVIRVSGPTLRWVDDTATTLRKTLGPYARSGLGALVHTPAANAAFVLLPFLSVGLLHAAGVPSTSPLMLVPLVLLAPLLYALATGFSPQNAARIAFDDAPRR